MKIIRLNYSDLHCHFKIAYQNEYRFREICGLLVCDSEQIRLLPVKNSALENFSFWMKKISINNELRRQRINYSEVIGTYHSHPYGDIFPGSTDIQGAREGKLILIFGCWKNKIGVWRVSKGKASKVILCVYK